MSFRSYCFVMFSMLVTQGRAPAQSPPDLARQIAELMAQGPSGKAHQRYVHAKGIVCQGTFQSSAGAASISRAAHFRGENVPITVRLSDGAPNINVADNSSDAAPRGIAIRFAVGRGTDIMAISHNGFIVGTGEDFLVLQQAISATDATKPHPWPIEAFLGSHPRALKFVQEINRVPASFAAESFYSNNALIFVDEKGEKRAGRYQIVPLTEPEYLDESAARAMSPNFLSDELRRRLTKAPVRFRLLVQLAAHGDQTSDSSLVWPDEREKIELGILTITAVVPDSLVAEKSLAFDPTRLIEGIELSDDPLPILRSRVYAYSVTGRRGK
jgi:catalase